MEGMNILGERFGENGGKFAKSEPVKLPRVI
jgi:hypothetical protein